MHILGTAGGVHLREGKQRVGSYPVDLDPQQPVFADAAQKASLFQRHTLYLQEPPPGYAITGWSTECPVEFIQSADGRIIGSQAHLEFRQDGLAILRGFARLFSQPILEVRMAIEPPLSEEALSWFRAPNLAYLATNEPDGQPQMTVVWVATSVAGEVIISTLKGRRKHINLLRAQQATILVLNPANVYSYCEIRGTATIDEDPGGGLIQELAQQYTGKPFTSDPPGAQRIIVRIRPHGVFRKD